MFGDKLTTGEAKPTEEVLLNISRALNQLAPAAQSVTQPRWICLSAPGLRPRYPCNGGLWRSAWITSKKLVRSGPEADSANARQGLKKEMEDAGAR